MGEWAVGSAGWREGGSLFWGRGTGCLVQGVGSPQGELGRWGDAPWPGAAGVGRARALGYSPTPCSASCGGPPASLCMLC